MITAKKIEKIVQTGAVHVLYRKDGTWYHHLDKFPGALFDINGFLVFQTREEYEKNQYLQHGKELSIPRGISSIPRYTKFTKEQKEEINAL